MQRETRQVSLDDANRVKVNISFGGGDSEIEGSTADLLRGEFVYNLPDLEPVIVYNTRGKQGTLVIRQKSETIGWERLTTEVRSEWRLRFTDRVPLDLPADVRTSNGKLELGGLRITDLDLTAGAADITVHFGRPNSERL